MISLSCSFHTSYVPHPALHSFPTRRSSDLSRRGLPSRSFSKGTSTKSGRSKPVPITSSLRSAQTGVMFGRDRKSTRLNSSHMSISYAVFCLKKKIDGQQLAHPYPPHTRDRD